MQIRAGFEFSVRRFRVIVNSGSKPARHGAVDPPTRRWMFRGCGTSRAAGGGRAGGYVRKYVPPAAAIEANVCTLLERSPMNLDLCAMQAARQDARASALHFQIPRTAGGELSSFVDRR